MEENITSIEIKLTAADMKRIEEIFPKDAASGARYPEAMMNLIGQAK